MSVDPDLTCVVPFLKKFAIRLCVENKRQAANLKTSCTCDYQRDPCRPRFPPEPERRAPEPPPGCFGTRFIYIQRSTVQIGAIQLSNSSLGCPRFRHFDEREAARLARVPVSDNIHALHAAVSSESRVEIIFGSLITEISDKYACHSMNSFWLIYLCRIALQPIVWKGNVAAGTHSKLIQMRAKTLPMYQFPASTVVGNPKLRPVIVPRLRGSGQMLSADIHASILCEWYRCC